MGLTLPIQEGSGNHTRRKLHHANTRLPSYIHCVQMNYLIRNRINFVAWMEVDPHNDATHHFGSKLEATDVTGHRFRHVLR